MEPESNGDSDAGAYTRGKDEAVIPVDPGQGKNCRLTAGTRSLHVRWLGGTPPYRLYLITEENGAKRTIAEKLVPGLQTDLPMIALEPGSYTLVLKDAGDFARSADPLKGPAYEVTLEVLPPEQRPPMPRDLAGAAASAELKQLLYAGWLAGQGEGEWKLEAMQLVAPLVADSQAAAGWMRQWGGQ